MSVAVAKMKYVSRNVITSMSGMSSIRGWMGVRRILRTVGNARIRKMSGDHFRRR
jgi:hypothetical protein